MLKMFILFVVALLGIVFTFILGILAIGTSSKYMDDSYRCGGRGD